MWRENQQRTRPERLRYCDAGLPFHDIETRKNGDSQYHPDRVVKMSSTKKKKATAQKLHRETEKMEVGRPEIQYAAERERDPREMAGVGGTTFV